MWLIIILLTIATYLVYKLFFSSGKNYWAKYGIRNIDTKVGAIDLFILGKTFSTGDTLAYNLMGNDKFCGNVEMGTPRLIIKDLDLIKKIFIKDFEYFMERRDLFNDPTSSLRLMLPALMGDEWKGVRTSVSPTFTTGKIRRMMEHFNSVGQEWIEELKRRAATSGNGSVVIDVSAVISTYTIEAIAVSVFGMKSGVIQDKNSMFAKMAARIVEQTKLKIAKFTLSIFFPTLFRKLKIPLMDPEAMNFFESILDQGLKKRMKGNVQRNDFLQLLVEAKKGVLKAEGNDDLNNFEKDAQIKAGSHSGKDNKQYLTNEIMNAQSLLFFLAGFGTTSNFLTFSSYLLALHQDVQKKLREEVDKIVKPDGTMDYDDLGRLVYMDMVVCEVLRKFPVAERLERRCVKDYKDPETGLVAQKGVFITIPMVAIHNDKKYYEKPDQFYPEHFSAESKAARNPYAYMPFGMGPRNCIGMRFALVESKAALANLVHNFNIEPTDKTPIPLKVKPAGVQVLPPDNLELKLTPRKAK